MASSHQFPRQVIFIMTEGVRLFDDKTNRFVPAPVFDVVSVGDQAHRIRQDSQGNVWVNFGRETALLRRQPDGSFKVDRTPVQRLAELAHSEIYPEPDGIVWFGGADGLFRYDPSIPKNYAVDYPALIRRVTAGAQTILYDGAATVATPAITVPYRDNALRFEFAATSLEDPASNLYQTKLEGFDNDWSAWSKETRRDYTNLPPKNLLFRVRARNQYGHQSAGAEFGFEVLPPWYRTWWAYTLDALALVFLAYCSGRIMRRRLLRREQERSRLREAELQSQVLRAENDRKRNVELLNEIGKELTASLEIDTIFYTLYQRVKQLVDAPIFGAAIYHQKKEEIEYRLIYNQGKRQAPYSRNAKNKAQLPVWCIDHRQPVFINDVDVEAGKYIPDYQPPASKSEDGSAAKHANSLIYLPLSVKDRVVGLVTVQSFEKNAYTEYHLNLLENLAAYTSIALDNAYAYRSLKMAQEQLMEQERLASLGALTAGIAHEIKNPLNFVNNFADLSVELNAELRAEVEKYRQAIGADDFRDIGLLLNDLTINAKKISEHGKRADTIVRSMLLHSRGQLGERQPTDINVIVEEYVNLSYHGMRAQDSSMNVTIVRDYADGLGTIEAVPQDLSRVLLNVLNNALYAANARSRSPSSEPGFRPTLRVRTVNLGDKIEVRVWDNGMGIPSEVLDRVFDPFFTTKPSGQGTGLGLSISNDIIVQHGGELEVETEVGQYTEFIIRLPRGTQARAS